MLDSEVKKPLFKLPRTLRMFAIIGCFYVLVWGGTMLRGGKTRPFKLQRVSNPTAILEQLKQHYAPPFAVDCGTYSSAAAVDYHEGNPWLVGSCSEASMLFGVPFKAQWNGTGIDSISTNIKVGDAAGRIMTISWEDYDGPLGGSHTVPAAWTEPKLSRNYWLARFLVILLLCHTYVKVSESQMRRKRARAV